MGCSNLTPGVWRVLCGVCIAKGLGPERSVGQSLYQTIFQLDAIPFYYSRVLYGMTPGDILSHPWRIDVRALPPYYKGLLSAWVAVDGGFYVPEDTLVVTSTTACTLSP